MAEARSSFGLVEWRGRVFAFGGGLFGCYHEPWARQRERCSHSIEQLDDHEGIWRLLNATLPYTTGGPLTAFVY